jgi:hypothetical protein
MKDVLDIISIVFASISLVLSLFVTWLTLLRIGTLQMTRPNIVAFVFEHNEPKIFLRTLLYSTAQRGQIVENMYLAVSQNKSSRAFTTWAHTQGEKDLVRGGMFVPQEGVVANHHFLLTGEEARYKFDAGEYTIEVYVELVGKKSPRSLFRLNITLNEREARTINNQDAGVIFDWEPNIGRYVSSLSNPHRSVG